MTNTFLAAAVAAFDEAEHVASATAEQSLREKAGLLAALALAESAASIAASLQELAGHMAWLRDEAQTVEYARDLSEAVKLDTDA